MRNSAAVSVALCRPWKVITEPLRTSFMQKRGTSKNCQSWIA